MSLAKPRALLVGMAVFATACIGTPVLAQDGAALGDSLVTAFKHRDFVGAVRFADSLLERNAGDVDALTLKGRALSSLGRFEEGYAVLSEAVSLAPAAVEPRLFRGVNRLLAEDPAGAVDDLNAAAEIAPGAPVVMDMQAAALFRAKRYPEAVAVLDDLVAMGYDAITTLQTRSEVKYRAGNVEGALEDANRAIAIAPGAAQGYRVLGEIHLREGKTPEALKDFNRAIELEKESEMSELRATAYVNRAYTRLVLNDQAGAAGDIRKGLELDPENPFAYRNRALLRIEAGNTEAACSDLRTALRHDFYTKYGQEAIYGDDAHELVEQHCNG
ncbi:MAG: tetratricopeptide repeat protein [Bacteroidota bacterium]